MKKKKIKIAAGILLIIAATGILWFKMPIDMMDLNSDDVLEIIIFNGDTGNVTHIKDREALDKITSDLNSVTLKREKISTGYMGYSFKTTIYLSDGNEADGWNNFIINSDKTIRKDPFFYYVADGNIDFEYIQSIVQ